MSYHNCDEGGKITKSYDNLIDMRFGGDDTATDVSNLYCPGKFDICCQDPDFVSLSSFMEEVLENEKEPVNEASFHLLHEGNVVGNGLEDDKKEIKSKNYV